VRGLLRASRQQPSSRELSWVRRRASPLSGGAQRVPRSSTRRSERIRPIPEVWQGHPCSRPRAPSRARRPEPSTRLSCLGPGYAPRTVSGCAALSCSRTHGVFISYNSLVEVSVTGGGCPRRSEHRSPRYAIHLFAPVRAPGGLGPGWNCAPHGRGIPPGGEHTPHGREGSDLDPPCRCRPAWLFEPSFPLRRVPDTRCTFA
jgi:hypothetical protein